MSDQPTSRPAPGSAGPRPARIRSRADLARELDRLRQRAARGSGRGRVSLERIASSTGIPRSTVHSYVRGTRLPPPDALDAIVVALGASPAEQAAWAQALERAAESADRAAPPPADDPAPVNPPAVPHQLPAAPTGFVGRAGELAALEEAAARARDEPDAPAVVSVTGIGGVGKTALVLQWAHRSTGLFPDGELWLDLRGFSGADPLQAADALERLLRAVGVGTAELPADLDARAAMFRSAVAGRRMLLVLDNARDSDHVRALLPGTRGFLTVVTSRDALRSLAVREGAVRVRVEPLPLPEAVALLSAGRPGMPGAGAVAERIAARCDGLPLALRIVRERLSSAGDGDVERLARVLEGDAAERLTALEIPDSSGGLGVRAVMEWSYRNLRPDAAALLRRLPLSFTPTVDLGVVRVLADADRATTQRCLDVLVTANLLDVAGPDQYRVHDLVAAYAAERLDEEEPAGVVAAARIRLLEYLVSTTEEVLHACDRSRPIRLARPEPERPELRPAVEPFPSSAAAQEWTSAHTDLLLAAIVDAARHGPPAYSWALAERAWRGTWFFGNVGVLEPGVRAMREAADRAGEGEPARLACRLLAIGYAQTARMDEAAAAFEEAISLATEAGDIHSARLDTANLAVLRAISGDVDWAVEALSRVIAAAPDGAQDQFPSMTSMVEIELQRGNLAAARDYAARAAEAPAITAREGSFYLELAALRADIEMAAGNVPAARALLVELIDDTRAAGYLQILSLALERLAVVQHRLGELGPAEASAREALAVAERIGYRSREIDAQATLGDIVRDAGRPADGLALCARALSWAREARVRYAECRTLIIAARARRDLGDPAAAAVDVRTALRIAEQSGYRRLRAEAAELVAELALTEAR